MSVTGTTVRTTAVSDGTTTTQYPFTFKIESVDELGVYDTSSTGVITKLVRGTNYNVTIVTSTSGYIQYVIPTTAGNAITMVRETAETQPASFGTGQGVPSEDYEASLDRLTLITQELNDKISRQFGVNPATNLSLISLAIPLSTVDGNIQYIAWNAAGTALQVVENVATGVITIDASWNAVLAAPFASMVAHACSGNSATATLAATATNALACSGNAATASSAAACSGNSASATTAVNALSCSGNSATATTAAACSGNAATATTSAACSGNSATATNATTAANATALNGAAIPANQGAVGTNASGQLVASTGIPTQVGSSFTKIYTGRQVDTGGTGVTFTTGLSTCVCAQATAENGAGPALAYITSNTTSTPGSITATAAVAGATIHLTAYGT